MSFSSFSGKSQTYFAVFHGVLSYRGPFGPPFSRPLYSLSPAFTKPTETLVLQHVNWTFSTQHFESIKHKLITSWSTRSPWIPQMIPKHSRSPLYSQFTPKISSCVLRRKCGRLVPLHTLQKGTKHTEQRPGRCRFAWIYNPSHSSWSRPRIQNQPTPARQVCDCGILYSLALHSHIDC